MNNYKNGKVIKVVQENEKIQLKKKIKEKKSDLARFEWQVDDWILDGELTEEEEIEFEEEINNLVQEIASLENTLKLIN